MNWSVVNKILNILLIILVITYVIYYFYKQPKFDSGEKAKDFSSVLADGASFTLSDLKGKYVLLDFWGSWCGPCRRENPQLVELYQFSKDKRYQTASGFEMVSVAIETNKESWQKAIQNDGLTWKNHIGEMDRFSSPIATLYGVKEIPTKYFIGPDGMIIFVNPNISDVKKYLEEKEIKE